MADCELLGGCIFFNDKMAKMPSTADLFKQSYCHNDFAACARFQIAKTLGRPKVPTDLYPNQKERVPGIVAKG